MEEEEKTNDKDPKSNDIEGSDHLEELVEKHTVELKREIAERKKMEEALRESEKKYWTLVENSKDAVIIIQDGVLKFANKAAIDMVGSTQEEMIDSDFLTWVAEESLTLVKRRYAQRILGKDVPGMYDVTLKKTDGTTVPGEVNATLIDYQGRPGDLVFIRDITERLKTKEELRKSEERLFAFMDSAPDLFALLDSELNLIEINKVGLKMLFPFGTRRSDIKGKNIGELLSQIKETGIYDRFLEITKTGRSFTMDNLIIHPSSGEQYLSLKAFKVNDGVGIIARNVTERRQMEEALRESEERLKTIFSSLDDLVFVLDKNGVFMDYFQPSKLSDMYVKPREFLGRSYRDIMPPTIVKLMEDAEAELSKTGEVQQFDYPLIIGGKETWFSAKVSIRKDNSGRFAGYTMVARNITQRKKAEEEVLRLAGAMKMSSDSVIICDIEGNIVDINDATLKSYGITDKKELIGKSFFDLLLPGAEEKALALMEELLEKGELKHQEIETSLSDGSVKTMEVSISLLKDEDGNNTVTVGIARDITERKKEEKVVMALKEKYEKLYRNAPIMCLSTDSAGIIIECNNMILDNMGYSREEMIGRPMTDFITEESVTKFKRDFPKLREHGMITGAERQLVKKSGDIMDVLLNVLMEYDLEGNPQKTIAIFQDITQLKKAEETLQESGGKKKGFFR
jgi:PAS domain S-box-containing protein